MYILFQISSNIASVCLCVSVCVCVCMCVCVCVCVCVRLDSVAQAPLGNYWYAPGVLLNSSGVTPRYS